MTFPSEALRNGLAKHGSQMPPTGRLGTKNSTPKKVALFTSEVEFFGRKSQQNLAYRCSLGRCFLKFMSREPHPTISSPPHPHFKAPALSVQGKVMCCEPQRFVCEKKYQPNLCATLEKRNETWKWGKMQFFYCDAKFYFWIFHLVDPSIHPSWEAKHCLVQT